MFWILLFSFLVLMLFLIIAVLVYKQQTSDHKKVPTRGLPTATIGPSGEIAINPTQREFKLVGIVTENNDCDVTSEIHETLPMKLLFGPRDASTRDAPRVKWNTLTPMSVHRGCLPTDTIQSPFIVECDNFELGTQLIDDFYAKMKVTEK